MIVGHHRCKHLKSFVSSWREVRDVAGARRRASCASTRRPTRRCRPSIIRLHACRAHRRAMPEVIACHLVSGRGWLLPGGGRACLAALPTLLRRLAGGGLEGGAFRDTWVASRRANSTHGSEDAHTISVRSGDTRSSTCARAKTMKSTFALMTPPTNRLAPNGSHTCGANRSPMRMWHLRNCWRGYAAGDFKCVGGWPLPVLPMTPHTVVKPEDMSLSKQAQD